MDKLINLLIQSYTPLIDDYEKLYDLKKITNELVNLIENDFESIFKEIVNEIHKQAQFSLAIDNSLELEEAEDDGFRKGYESKCSEIRVETQTLQREWSKYVEDNIRDKNYVIPKNLTKEYIGLMSSLVTQHKMESIIV